MILASPSTIHMNAITETTIITLYPRVTFQDEGLVLQGQNMGEVQQMTPSSASLAADNSHWKKECGIYCPEIWRKTYGNKGIAQYPWSQKLACFAPATFASATFGGIGRGRREKERLLEELLEWRLSARCMNPVCSNKIKHNARAKYLDL